MYCGARSAPRLPHALSALGLLARLLPEGQAALRALRVSPGLQGTPSILRWMARIYSAAGMKIYGFKVFSKTRLDPCRLILGYNALAMRRHFPRVYAAPITVSRPQCGFDHGVGHSLLVLCDAKAPHGKKWNDFKALENYLFIVSISLS